MADFSIETHELKRCILITLNGRIDSSKAPIIETKLREMIDAGHYRFVVDMSEVEFVSSAFLRVLISASKTVRRFNRGDIYLAALSARIKDVFDLAGLLSLFKLYDTQVEAVGNW
ncbi:MAG TPA: STAS domain-containing protein [Anaerolineae bacterium]|nr:STAS domain-containing protein [Anaerolineae bacterium]